MKTGERVYVDDPGLASLRAMMRSFGEEPRPNHIGTVDIIEDDFVWVIFDDTLQSAPYSVDDVYPLKGEPPA